MQVEKEGRMFMRRGEKSTFYGYFRIDGKQYRFNVYPNVGEDDRVDNWGGNIKENDKESD